MLEDEGGSNRVKGVRNREGAYLEQKVMEEDKGPSRTEVNQPSNAPGGVEASKSQDVKNMLLSKAKNIMLESRMQAAKRPLDQSLSIGMRL